MDIVGLTATGTFAIEIAHDIFANHSVESLEAGWYPRRILYNDIGRILDNNIGILLFNRLKKPLGANPEFLDKIREMASFLVAELARKTEQEYQKLLMQLCLSIAAYLGRNKVFSLLHSVQPEYNMPDIAYLKAPLDLAQMLIAAVAVDAHDLATTLLSQMSEKSPWRIQVFGSPLTFAIDRGSEQIVRTILDCSVHSGTRGVSIQGVFSEYDIYGTWTPMAHAIGSRQPGVLRVIKEFHEKHIGPSDKKMFNTLLSRAIRSGMIQIVQIILHLKVPRGATVTMNHLIGAANAHSPEIMLAITSAPGMGINRRFKNTSPLIAAVQARDVHVVRALLNAGADVDMKVDANGPEKSALSVAIEAGYDVITQVLLDHGATLPPASRWPKKTSRKCKGVLELLYKEERKRST